MSPSYEFARLSANDFQQVVHDLLESHFRCELEQFSEGPDQGIDLRSLDGLELALLVQCKHHPHVRLGSLTSKLKREVPKVHALKPDRYILATSARATPAAKSKVYDLFRPYMLAPDEIYDEQALTQLLNENPDIVQRSFKLWLASIDVLQLVLHNEVFVRSRMLEQNIEQQICLYVQNRSFPIARAMLRDEHVCIISGAPGIGKTMLAKILLVSYLAEDFEAVSVSDDIDEAYKVYHPTKRQVFYYDDFLGQTTSLEKTGKNEDARLIDFINQVRRSSNKRLIMTTREYILAHARSYFERLDRENLDVWKCVIDLTDYSRLDRARILYNHLYFAHLDREFYAAITNDRAYWKIIKHRNYSPRVIETVTKLARAGGVASDQFCEFFIASLEDPAEVWRHSFEHLDNGARSLLYVLGSLPPDVDLEELRMAYRTFHQQRLGIAVGPGQVRHVLKLLEDTFIRVERVGEFTIVGFHNPAVRDFVHGRWAEEPDEYLALLEAAEFFDQALLLASYGGLDVSGVGRREGTRWPALALALSSTPEPLLGALERTLHARECALSVTRHGRLRVAQKETTTSREERVRAVLAALRGLGRTSIPSWVEAELELVAETWRRSEGSKQAAIGLIQELDHFQAAGTQTRSERYIHMARDWFVQTLDTTGDYEILAKLRTTLPIPVEINESISDELTLVIASEFEVILDDASTVEELQHRYDRLVSLATSYGLDPAESLDLGRFEERAQELEAEDWEEADDEAWRDAASELEEEEAIDLLFETLGDS